MFTGLVETLGTISHLESKDAGRDLFIIAPSIAPQAAIGESIAVNGACLTVVMREGNVMQFQAGPETLQRTNLGQLHANDRVNLERSLRIGDQLGGHMVQGHIDGLGKTVSREPDGEWVKIWFQCAPDLTSQMVSKGSVAVDGVSLTLVDVASDRFSVALIPHTLAVTTLGFRKPGDTVNLETDILAKYVRKYLETYSINLQKS